VAIVADPGEIFTEVTVLADAAAAKAVKVSTKKARKPTK
jgi:hypothetical protein